MTNKENDYPILIVGPCAAENEEQVYNTASQLSTFLNKETFSTLFFRAGAWKPRSEPKSFEGVGEIALGWLQNVKNKFNLKICTEVALAEHVIACQKFDFDAYWIGARTTVNPFLVEEIAQTIEDKNKIILIKNPISPDLKLWIGAIERFQKAGFTNIIAVHRGFASQSECVYRNAPYWEIPVALRLNFPNLPIICDASHLAGVKNLIENVAQTALNYGFNGLMLEVHENPELALSDAQQQITPQEFKFLLNNLNFKIQNNSEAENKLLVYRNKISAIDAQIANLLAQRMNAVDEITEIKKNNNIPLLQPDQWSKVVEIYNAEKLPDEQFTQFLNRFLTLLHNSSLERQQNKINIHE